MPHPLTALVRGAFAALLMASAAGTACAGWNAAQETLATHPSWIYTPAGTLANGKHGLMVVLHGCAQKNTELKSHGNLAPAAEAAGLVLVLPQVRANNQWGPGCWDFDGGNDGHHHVAQLISLTKLVIARASLHIDADQVYVVGLSSGGALSLLLGCAAPDLYAGVAAIAGPSAGSDQEWAATPAIGILDSNVADAVARCQALAGTKRSFFATQIAHVAYGTMDKDGPDAHFDPCPWAPINPWFCPKQQHPGQYRVVSVKWSEDNAKVLRRVYGDDALGDEASVQDGAGVERSAKGDGKVQLGLLAIANVGHAWPAGTGQPNGAGGDWIAQSGLDYPRFITQWLLRHNRRATAPP